MKMSQLWIIIVVLWTRVVAERAEVTSSNNGTIHLQIVPQVALIGDHMDIRCNYELEHAIYSIKFYKDGSEFYRYIPRDEHPVRIFALRGVRVQRTEHFHNSIRLLTVDEETQGLFKCEVSSEGPFFETHSDELQVLVQDNPKDPPQLTYSAKRLDGEFQFKCRSPDDSLAGQFQWTVDGKHVQAMEGVSSVSHLDYSLNSGAGWSSVECRLFLGSVYNRSTEVILFQDLVESRSTGAIFIPYLITIGVIIQVLFY